MRSQAVVGAAVEVRKHREVVAYELMALAECSPPGTRRRRRDGRP
jgi:hypothetical protein